MGGDEGDDGGHGAAAAVLLERVRRLCAAVNMAATTALPPLATQARASSQSRCETRESGAATRLGSGQRVGGCPAPQKLPLLPSKGNSAVKIKPTRPPLTQPPVEQTAAQQRRKEAQKVRQARERAQARIARSNQQEQQQAQQQEEQQRLAAIEAADKFAERLRIAEEGRSRAQERVRLKRLARQCNQERDVSAAIQPVARMETPSAPLDAPKRERKLKPAPPTTAKPMIVEASRDSEQKAEPEETSVEREDKRKLKERRIRLETMRRLRRAQQAAEDDKRREADAIQRGLEVYRTRQRELDRIAKGLGRREELPAVQSSQESLNRVGSAAFEELEAEAAADVEHSSAVIEDVPDCGDGRDESCSDVDSNLDLPIERLAITLTDNEAKPSKSEQNESRSTSKRTPPWKRPPVPLLPTECYATKAIILPCSRAIVTADSYTEKHKLKRLNHSPSAPKCFPGR